MARAGLAAAVGEYVHYHVPSMCDNNGRSVVTNSL
jgi:hypothetical protein